MNKNYKILWALFPNVKQISKQHNKLWFKVNSYLRTEEPNQIEDTYVMHSAYSLELIKKNRAAENLVQEKFQNVVHTVSE